MKKLFVLPALFWVCFQSQAQDTTSLWLRYPAISPNGQTIAFAYQGDIYTVPRDGGDARPLTIHEAYESMPIWSPDGSKIAFASRRHGNDDVFVIDALGGTPIRLTYHSSNDTPSDFSTDGSKVIFTSSRLDHFNSVLFPSGVLPELYEVHVSGGRELQIMTTPAELARVSADGSKLIFHDRKGYEDSYRKHHTSSIARDIWTYDLKDSTYNQITNWEGEDRNPVWKGVNSMYFLSERSGSFNVWEANISQGEESKATQISEFNTHPVRCLSMAEDGTLCYWYNGDIYIQKKDNAPKRVQINVRNDRRYNEAMVELINGDAESFEVSPNGKEIAFIVRGEVFVTAIDYSLTRRITDTPEQERSIDFNSDGTKLLYAAERNGSWNIYEASLGREEDKYFYNASVIEEKPIVVTAAETFQPRYSPNDEEVAFLENRTELKVKNLKSQTVRTVMPANYSYSYSDGDQYYEWSPDSKWFLVQYISNGRWNSQIGLVSASGKEEPNNLSQSGYGNSRPKFGMGGEVVYWASDMAGMRAHGSWGSQDDVYAIFFTRDAYSRFIMDEADYALWKEINDEEDKNENEEDKDDDAVKKKNKDKKDNDEKAEPLVVEWQGLQDRKVKMTIFSSYLADFLLDEKGENLYIFTSTGGKHDLWQTKFKDKQTKVLAQLNADGSDIQFDKEQKHIFLNNSGNLTKIKVDDGSSEGVTFNSEMNLNTDAERAYMFEHAWRQFRDKFYLKNLHGVDWEMYKSNYESFLPSINNRFDFADLLSEMLGEVNASHTGARAWIYEPTFDQTASLGVYFDESHQGAGLRIAEIMDKSPLLMKEGAKKQGKDELLGKGLIIERIDGDTIKVGQNYLPYLNRKAGKKTLIAYYNPKNGKRWTEVVEPIGPGKESELAYERWVKMREAAADSLSDGLIGYVHVRGMNSDSFRELYSKALGQNNAKKALVVDTRFNGGGWLHDDLATFLSGEAYMQFVPRGQENMGGEPLAKWQKPTAVLISESNYSDAHLFPYVYKYMGIGKLVGMPVPGTGTAVWWEEMLDGTVFGIPEVGMRDMRTGLLVENQSLEPDIKVPNQPGLASKGRDEQLEAGVRHLLEITK